MDNALAFSPEDEEVLISIRNESDSTEVRVIDHGPGIDPDRSQRIFDPLEQAESLNNRTHQGVGLGLTLARMSARAMDGDVTLEQPGPRSSIFLWRLAPAGSRPRRYLKRRMWMFSSSPTAMKFASIALPP